MVKTLKGHSTHPNKFHQMPVWNTKVLEGTKGDVVILGKTHKEKLTDQSKVGNRSPYNPSHFYLQFRT